MTHRPLGSLNLKYTSDSNNKTARHRAAAILANRAPVVHLSVARELSCESAGTRGKMCQAKAQPKEGYTQTANGFRPAFLVRQPPTKCHEHRTTQQDWHAFQRNSHLTARCTPLGGCGTLLDFYFQEKHHTWAKHIDDYTLRVIAGHTDMNATKRYVHPSDADVLAAKEKARGAAYGSSDVLVR